GRDEDARNRDEDEAAEERVEGGEDLADVVLEVADRPHSRKDHRGVQERVNPGELREVMVAEHAHAEREGDDGEREREATRDAHDEGAQRQKRLVSALEHSHVSVSALPLRAGGSSLLAGSQSGHEDNLTAGHLPRVLPQALGGLLQRQARAYLSPQLVAEQPLNLPRHAELPER